MTQLADVTTTPVWGQGSCTRLNKGEYDPQDNPDNLISKQAAFWVNTIDSTVFIPLLFLVGVPGNVLSAVAFCRLGLRERINLCVFCLSLSDLMVIAFTFFLSVEQVYRDLVGPASFFITYCVGLTGFIWVSQFLSAAIASERCFCVVSPLHAQRYLRTRTMGVIIVLTSATLLAGMLTVAGHKHIIACVWDPATNTTSDILYFTNFYNSNRQYLDIVDIFVYSTALPFIFVIVIVVTTIITVIKLRSAARWRQQTANVTSGTKNSAALPATSVSDATHMPPAGIANGHSSGHRSSNITSSSNSGGSSHRELAVTKMLIATSILFIVCLTPLLLARVAMFVVPNLDYGKRYHNLTSALWSVISVFRCVSCSINFFIYYRMGSRFRETLRDLLRNLVCRLKNKD